MSDPATRMAQLSLEQRILLEERLLARAGDEDGEQISRRSNAEHAPLSYGQERLWFLTQIEPESPAYNEMRVWLWQGVVDLQALEQGLNFLAKRHDSLRTCFREIDGALQQIAAPLSPVQIPIIDLRTHPPTAQMDEAWRQVETIRTERFDLSQPPLWRTALIRLTNDEQLFVHVVHHIISDGWSSAIFQHDLSHCYAAFAAGNQPTPPDLTVSYADYAAWQRDQLQGDRLTWLTRYWLPRLADLQPLNLPTDRPRPLEPSYEGQVESFAIEIEQTAALKALARSANASLYMLLLAAFQALLHRIAGQDDIAVGTPVANRTRFEVEGVYGFFVNTLVMRSDCRGNPTFRGLLDQVRQNALDAYRHQELPFEKLVDALHPAREPNRNPLFDVYFAMQNMPKGELTLPGLACKRLKSPKGSSKFDLSVYVFESGDTLVGSIEYATDLFDASTARRFVSHYKTLLEGVVADPDCPIDALPLLTHIERRQILVDWNETAANYPLGSTIHQLFQEQAICTPNSVAIIDGMQRSTYREVEEAANRLAHRLVQLDVQPGESVGICLQRSANLIIAMLATLKAGAAWLPLDPANPEERLAWMVQDAGMTKLISTTTLAALFPTEPQFTILMDQLESSNAVLPVDPPEVSTDAGDVAYVLYTSGSTGRPKGVIAPHRGTVNRFHWMWEQYPFGEGEIACQRAAATFVDSVWEIFGPLLCGCPIAIAPDTVAVDPTAFVQFLAEQQVSRVTVVPTLLTHLLDVYEQNAKHIDYPSLWICSGEALTSQPAARFSQLLPRARLLNLYGSSEVAGDVTCWEMDRQLIANSVVPIGFPIANARTYILDASMNPVPISVPGELYVGGAGLALGYLNRPELTAERFVPDPFTPAPASRLYRTGDLARYRSDGNIEFLGRADGQIKLRGHRIEVGEIEFHLNSHPAVHQSAVVSSESEADEPQLIGYYVLSNRQPIFVEELFSHLRSYLPAYMVPFELVQLDLLPLTSSGKVDRRALPKPDLQTRRRTSSLDTPRSPFEGKLAAIWSEVLKIKRVDIHDNFFDLGGHSLLGVQLFARIEKEFGVRLPLSLLFRAQTVFELVKHLGQPQTQKHASILVPIREGGSHAPFFCVHGFGGGVLGYVHLANLMEPDRPFWGLQAQGLDDNAPFDTSIKEMATRYIEAMRVEQPTGPYHIGGYCLGGVVAYEMARQLEAVGERVALIAVMEGFAPGHYHRRDSVFGLQRWLTIWRNIPYWLEDYWNLGLERIQMRIQTKIRRWYKHIFRAFRGEHGLRMNDIALDDLSAIPNHQRELMEAHLNALRRYSAGPLQGQVTLFAARGKTITRALFGSADPENGWGSLAQGGVDVKVVDGGHRNIHLPPYVSSLAQALEESLREAEALK